MHEPSTSTNLSSENATLTGTVILSCVGHSVHAIDEV